MDWYYPVLCGALRGASAREHLARHWDRFVVTGYGCRCVDDAPWVTVAESAELVVATARTGNIEAARALFWPLANLRKDDGSYWTGTVLPNEDHWPVESTTWTAGAVLLAADAIFHLSPAATLFGPSSLNP
jgi:hypothetical protein